MQMTVSKTSIGTVHAMAECRDCPWSDQNYRKAENRARRHAATTGHTVHVERGQAWTYNPKREDGK